MPQLALESGSSHHTGMGSIQDPTCSKKTGAPKKLRKKNPLESISSTAKVMHANRSLGKGRKLRAPHVKWETVHISLRHTSKHNTTFLHRSYIHNSHRVEQRSCAICLIFTLFAYIF